MTTLDSLLEQVEMSSSDDWHKLDYHTPYLPYCGGQNVLDTHYHLAVFRPDVDISLAFGATVNSDFHEPWVESFPDPHATSVAVVLRYRGTPVYEWTFVTVDGGRYLVPMPQPPNAEGKYQISAGKLSFARLMFDLYGSGGVCCGVEEALRRAGIEISD
jgi:hypothetical protein